MKKRSLCIATAMGFVMSAVVVAGNASAHPTVSAGSTSTVPPSLSTSGDYATDVLGDPWDFSEQGDVPPHMTLGTEASDGISWDPAGALDRRRARWFGHQARAQLRRRAALGSRRSAAPDRCQHLHKFSFSRQLQHAAPSRRALLERSRPDRHGVPCHVGLVPMSATVRTSLTSPGRRCGRARSCVSTADGFALHRWWARRFTVRSDWVRLHRRRCPDVAAVLAGRTRSHVPASKVAPTTRPCQATHGTSPRPTTSSRRITSSTRPGTAPTSTARPAATTRT